ncbi:MAG TPA: YciI family protein [Candidatus Acidoferrum sp.]
MRYMMLIYTKEGHLSQMSPETAQQIREAHAAVMRETRERGMLVAVNGLGRTNTATTVRLEAGKVLATDGAFAETKEQLAGYYVLDCVDLDEAIYWAGRIPSSCGGAQGSIEIRQLVEFENVPESMLKPHRVAVASVAD